MNAKGKLPAENLLDKIEESIMGLREFPLL